MERQRKAVWRAKKRCSDSDYVSRIRKYDRDRKQKVKMEKMKQDNSLHNSSRNTLPEPSTPTKPNNPTYYRVLKTSKEVQGILGPSPKTHVSVLKHIIKKAMKSPRKSECLTASPFKLHPAVSSTFITPSKCSVTKELRKIAVLKSKQKHQQAMKLADGLKSQFKYVKDIAVHASDDEKAVYRLLSPPKSRIKEEYLRKLSDEVKNEIERIYNDNEVSYCLPDMKLAGLRFMSCTISEAHRIYLQKCTNERKVAEKTFAALKPKYVKTIQETPLRGCSCEYCENFAKNRETLIGLGIKGIPRKHSASIEITLCPFRQHVTDEMDIRNFVVRDELPGKKCVE